jgi:fermentation-respiration switch protein FrsA (DUF1100 family)
MKNFVIAGIALLFALYFTACAYMYMTQRSLLFPVDTDDVGQWVDQVPGAQNIVLTTPDGIKLKAWWKAPANGQEPVYLYFHGNSETLLSRAERLAALTAGGAGLLAVSWRGYGGSEGDPSEAGLLADARTAWDWLEARVPSRQVIIYGESLGTGIAVHLASEKDAAGLILDSPYTAIVDVAAERYPWLPVRLLSKDHFDSLLYAGQVTEPAFVYHCTMDTIVPFSQGEVLFAALGSPIKAFTPLPRRCHVPSIEPLLPELASFAQSLGFIR